MFRNQRYFGKNEGKHNLFGELEYVQDWDESPTEDSGEPKEESSGDEDES